MEIRRLTLADEAAFLRYRRDCVRLDRKNPYAKDILQTLSARPAAFPELLAKEQQQAVCTEQPAVNYYLFTKEQAIAGRVRLRLGHSAILARSGGHISYYVAPGTRGSGYGRELFVFALTQFKAKGAQFVILSARAGNSVSRHMIESAAGKLLELFDTKPYDGEIEKLAIYRIELING